MGHRAHQQQRSRSTICRVPRANLLGSLARGCRGCWRRCNKSRPSVLRTRADRPRSVWRTRCLYHERRTIGRRLASSRGSVPARQISPPIWRCARHAVACRRALDSTGRGRWRHRSFDAEMRAAESGDAYSPPRGGQLPGGTVPKDYRVERFERDAQDSRKLMGGRGNEPDHRLDRPQLYQPGELAAKGCPPAWPWGSLLTHTP